MYKIKVITHSGKEEVVESDLYDPIMINEQINNNEILTLVIGDQIFSRIDIKHIKPIEENVPIL